MNVLLEVLDAPEAGCKGSAGTWLCFVNLVVVAVLNWLDLLNRAHLFSAGLLVQTKLRSNTANCMWMCTQDAC
jgi:hypothetical protein